MAGKEKMGGKKLNCDMEEWRGNDWSTAYIPDLPLIITTSFNYATLKGFQSVRWEIQVQQTGHNNSQDTAARKHSLKPPR